VRPLAGPGVAAWLCVLVAACNEINVGYVELKAFPGLTAPLYVNKVKVDSMKNGVTVLREQVGRTTLYLERNGNLYPLCDFDVMKNRIITVTVSAFDRAPRCELQK